MALKVHEFFGYAPSDCSTVAATARSARLCPFLGAACIKRYPDGVPMGACTLKPTKSGPVICCPIRLYAEKYKILLDVARFAFGQNARLIRSMSEAQRDGCDVVVFGKGWGKELRLPSRAQKGGYFVDWVLALIDATGGLQQFVAVEVQTMDTTGTYRPAIDAYHQGDMEVPPSKAGINWENVSKRILPQIIYKGHVLRREPLCKQGLFFVCPTPVYMRIAERLGGKLEEYHPQPGALTFQWYDLDENYVPGTPRSLVQQGRKTTTVDQVALAFTSPSNLPAPRVYEMAIQASLAH